jgi:hypothetical protein
MHGIKSYSTSQVRSLINSRKTQNELLEAFSKSMQSLPRPDLYHTWAQAPVKFEDALGRIIPIPSEYDGDVSLIEHEIEIRKLNVC